MTDNNRGNRPHASAPETISLELVIQSTVGTQVDVMYFGYNELRRRGDDTVQLDYLQTEIRALHPRLDVTSSAARNELRRVLRDWRPNLDSIGRFTIQLPGELGLSDAAQSREYAEIERLRDELKVAIEKVHSDKKGEMIERVKGKAREEQLKKLQDDIDRIIRESKETISRVSSDRDAAERALLAARTQASAMQGQLDTLKAEQAHGGQRGANSGPQDSQLYAEVTRLQLQLDAALRQLEALEHGQGQTPPWGATSPHGEPQPGSNTAGPGGASQPPIGSSAYDDYPTIPKPGKPLVD